MTAGQVSIAEKSLELHEVLQSHLHGLGVMQ